MASINTVRPNQAAKPAPSSPHPSTPSQQDENQSPHSLALKVMRLSRPSLANNKQPTYQDADAASLSNSLTPPDEKKKRDDTKEGSASDMQSFGLDEVLVLPSAFGNIYLGETFSTYLCINNESKDIVHEIKLKAELQTSSQRFNLADTNDTPLASMDPGASNEFVISHEIKELGVHILVCLIHYTTPDGQPRSFRKFYKFQVANPLAVKTKVNNMIDGKVFLEAQVQNVSANTMLLERMRFEAAEHFNFEDLNYIQTEEDEGLQLTFGSQYLNQHDVRQYLYLLTPKNAEDDRIARTTNTLGKLDIVWRTTMGEMGRLQTSQLTRKVPILEELQVQAFNVPSTKTDETGKIIKGVKAEEPFTIGFRIRNHSSQAMRVVLSAVKTKMGSVLLSGINTRQLGELLPEQTIETTVEFFPLSPGLQKVGGLKIADAISGYAKEIDHLCDVFVEYDD
ncbi:hypothetical protein INT43_007766 [Umbelopsis isabellina]|uniref:Trafficking protein particle complex subunit 13 n=1 Tax=Mortierella isabellina TaxID=91625 RepID=A0A8H7UBS4_MORIS|nr:hypothetical protein INT43_007766 [Umbelopsis isabellina]